MQPIDTSPIARSRLPGADGARSVRNAPAAPGSAASPPAEPGVIAEAKTPAAGTAPPVDMERVSQIRTALREGNYPLLPAKLADAMIAADYILIEGRKD